MWSMLEECVGQLDEPFRRSEIIGWFRRHHPDVNESTLAAHVQAATANATNRAQNNPLGTRPPLLRRVDHGLYVRAGLPRESAAHIAVQVHTVEPHNVPSAGLDVVLVGCVRTKRAAALAIRRHGVSSSPRSWSSGSVTCADARLKYTPAPPMWTRCARRLQHAE